MLTRYEMPDWHEALNCVLASVCTGQASLEVAQEFLRLAKLGAESENGETDWVRLSELCTVCGIEAKQVIHLSPEAMAAAERQSR